MNKFDTLFNQILNEQDYDASQFDPRILNKRPVADYTEPKEDLGFKDRERNAGLGPNDKDKDTHNPFYYAFKNDIFEKRGKVFWVFAGPKVTDQLTTSVKRKFKDITSLVKPGSPTEIGALKGQEFQGKFNKFKIVRIEPEEQRQRQEKTPSGILGAFYKAVPVS